MLHGLFFFVCLCLTLCACLCLSVCAVWKVLCGVVWIAAFLLCVFVFACVECVYVC